MILIFLSCHEKAHDNKEISHENSKPCRESQITTCQTMSIFRLKLVFILSFYL